MKTTTKVIGLILGLCVLAFVPLLQAKNDNAKQLDKIDKTVGGLSLIQKWKINDILTTAQIKVKTLPPEDRRAKGEEIRKASMEEVRKNLSFAQQKKFDAVPKGDAGPNP